MQPNCADNLLRAVKTFMSQVKIGLATGKHVKPVQPVSYKGQMEWKNDAYSRNTVCSSQ